MADDTTARRAFSGVCSAPVCGAPSMEDVPFPVCERHYVALVRHYNQVVSAHGLVLDEWSEVAGLGVQPQAPIEDVREVVYFIRYRDRIKIGTTIRLRDRLRALPFDDLLAVIPGGREVERDWHLRYEGHRDHGEWFAYTEAMIDTIRALGICA